jgi:hypothetical protein
MRQRHFIAMLGSAAAGWLAIVRAQQPQMKRIGALVIGNADVPSFSTELREGLGEFGHIEGQNYVLDRSAEGQLSRLGCEAGHARNPDRDPVGRSARDGSGREPVPARREHHRPVADGR